MAKFLSKNPLPIRQIKLLAVLLILVAMCAAARWSRTAQAPERSLFNPNPAPTDLAPELPLPKIKKTGTPDIPICSEYPFPLCVPDFRRI